MASCCSSARKEGAETGKVSERREKTSYVEVKRVDAKRGVDRFDDGREERLGVGSHGCDVVEAGKVGSALLGDEESEGGGIGGEKSVRRGGKGG